jgi:hypothetical protein
VRPKEHADFPLEFRRLLQQMGEAYIESTGACMIILRLYLTYRRAADGRLFATTTFYAVTGDGAHLVEISCETPHGPGEWRTDIFN